MASSKLDAISLAGSAGTAAAICQVFGRFAELRRSAHKATSSSSFFEFPFRRHLLHFIAARLHCLLYHVAISSHSRVCDKPQMA